MCQHYNQRYTKAEVAQILQIIHDCVQQGRYTIAFNENRRENREFIQAYNIRPEKQRRILLQIESEDFCHSLQNTKVGFEHEVLYVFCPRVTLHEADDEMKCVDIYIKFNIVDVETGNKVVVISFHECNRPIGYCFR